MLLNFFFQQSAVVTLLAKSRRDHHCRFHTRVDTLTNNFGYGQRRRHHQRQIDSAGDVTDVLIGFESEYFSVTGIDRINFDGKLALQQI